MHNLDDILEVTLRVHKGYCLFWLCCKHLELYEYAF